MIARVWGDAVRPLLQRLADELEIEDYRYPG